MDAVGEVISEGCVWKKILTPGVSRISQMPVEGSTCLLKIEDIRLVDNDEKSHSQSLASLLREQNTTILKENDELTIIMGEADCELDKRLEAAVTRMKDLERSLITLSVQDPVTGLEIGKIDFQLTLTKHYRFKPIWEWSPLEKYNIAMKYKNTAVKLFKDSEFSSPRFKDAFYRFSRACKILITLEPIDDLALDKELQDNIIALRLKLYNNMAACQGKHHNYYHVIELCSKVLSRNDRDVLTLFRRGYAYGELKDYERAVQDFTALLSIEPTNKQAILKLQHYRSCLRQANIHCNEMVKRMFKTVRASR